MPIFDVRHETTYRYRRPVAFGEHRMMLRPRDDADQTVLDASIEITPAPAAIAWERDVLGNHIAIASFADRAKELRFVSRVRIEQTAERGADPVEHLPTAEVELAARGKFDQWAALFAAHEGPRRQHDLAAAVTKSIDRGFRHVARHAKGFQTPAETLARGTGTCRDFAVLMIEALKVHGIAARFVSGYLHLPNDPPERTVGGNTHAWVQASVDGAWVDFDPSHGTIGNRNLVRVAVVEEPNDAIPLQGIWFGSAADHLAMDVSVKVIAARGGLAKG